jgi:hypothetical protein
VKKIVIDGKPREIDGKKHDFKVMLYQFARDRSGTYDLGQLVEVLRRAQKCMGAR